MGEIWLIRIVFIAAIAGGTALIVLGAERIHDRKRRRREQEQQRNSDRSDEQMFDGLAKEPEQRDDRRISIMMIVIGTVLLAVIFGLIVYACMALKAMT
ncbi:MAG: hypothetical protein IK130_04940 [Oscillospiraceae bacterium]|nr:hypothetical protein [Oscillospiraceae bacterium]